MHTSPRLLLDSLKRCPLCAAVNAEASDCCFVCGWSGEFERDADDLQNSLDAIVARCPELAGLRPRRPRLSKWSDRLRRLFGTLKRAGSSFPKPSMQK